MVVPNRIHDRRRPPGVRQATTKQHTVATPVRPVLIQSPDSTGSADIGRNAMTTRVTTRAPSHRATLCSQERSLGGLRCRMGLPGYADAVPRAGWFDLDDRTQNRARALNHIKRAGYHSSSMVCMA